MPLAFGKDHQNRGERGLRSKGLYVGTGLRGPKSKMAEIVTGCTGEVDSAPEKSWGMNGVQKRPSRTTKHDVCLRGRTEREP